MTSLTPIYKISGDVKLGAIKGKVGRLEMISIERLVVDELYQRAFTPGSVRNIRKIVAAFDWAKFTPIIVTAEGDYFAIIDGQHRATAAYTLGIAEVPCYVMACSAAEAAGAFAAINGNVTPMAPIDLWFAELAANRPEALALQRVLDAASVKITRKSHALEPGETRSIKVLQRAFDFYGGEILTTILQCIVETRTGNAGMLLGSVINGVGRALRTKPEAMADPSKLFEAFDAINLPHMLHVAKIENARTSNPVQHIITRQVNQALAAAFTKDKAA